MHSSRYELASAADLLRSAGVSHAWLLDPGDGDELVFLLLPEEFAAHINSGLLEQIKEAAPGRKVLVAPYRTTAPATMLF